MDFISTETDYVLTLSLNRPKVHNAFNDQLISDLTAYLEKKATDPNLRLLILKGEGKSFSAGADLNWMKGMLNYSEEENKADSYKLANLFKTLNEFPCPVLGVIHGAALGGGSGLVSVCDYVVASEDCRFGFTEVHLGLIPAVISPFVMAKIGEGQARRYFLTGERFSADQALKMGLIHEVQNLENLEQRVSELVKVFIKAAPQAQRMSKELIKNVINLSEEEITEYTCQTIAGIRVSSEGQEGMSALLEKRKANWLKGK